MSSPSAREHTPSTPARSPVVWIVVAALLGFVVAFAVQQVRLSRAEHAVARTAVAWHAARLEATLAGAVIEAQAGRLEAARVQASTFYTGLQRNLMPRLDPPQRDSVRRLLGERDSVITALARNDPGSAGALQAILVRARTAMHTNSTAAPGSD